MPEIIVGPLEIVNSENEFECYGTPEGVWFTYGMQQMKDKDLLEIKCDYYTMRKCYSRKKYRMMCKQITVVMKDKVVIIIVHVPGISVYSPLRNLGLLLC